MPRMTLETGCTACQREWDAPKAEGQCSRCRRCLECCGRPKVRFSCTAKSLGKTTEQRARSDAAYQRYVANDAILPARRRLGC